MTTFAPACLVALTRCARHNRPYGVVPPAGGDVDERFVCPEGCEVPIRGHIPRFVGTEHYAGSFSHEWQSFRSTQLDSVTGTSMSAVRLERCLGFPLVQLSGLRVLEVGCGAGRFTEILAAHRAWVCSLDLSEAVEVAYSNVGAARERCLFVQTDAVRAPFAADAFDVVLCLGVLQHTADPRATLEALARHVKPGGLVVVDSYAWTWGRVLALRYPVRFLVKHLSYETAHALCGRMVAAWLPLHRRIGRRRWLHAIVSRVSPIASYYHAYPELTDRQQSELAHLDTVDFHTPRYERLQTAHRLRQLVRAAGLELASITPGGNGLEVRARKPR